MLDDSPGATGKIKMPIRSAAKKLAITSSSADFSISHIIDVWGFFENFA
jgi:hypothetical protein